MAWISLAENATYINWTTMFDDVNAQKQKTVVQTVLKYIFMLKNCEINIVIE